MGGEGRGVKADIICFLGNTTRYPTVAHAVVVAQLLSALVRPSGTTSVAGPGGRSLALFIVFLVSGGYLTMLVTHQTLGFFTPPPNLLESLGSLAVPTGMLAASETGPLAFSDWLVGLIPRNPLEAAVRGDILQILIFTVLLGVAVGRLPDQQKDPLAAVFRSLADAMLIMVSWVVWGTPVGVFAIMLAHFFGVSLSIADLSSFLVGSLLIGSGIFRVPSSVAGSVESVGAIVLIKILGGVLALFGSLVVAELSCMYAEAGGVYVFLREAYGRPVAFIYGWTRLLLLTPASLGAMSLILAAYLSPLLPWGGVGERWIAAVVILFVMALNFRSLLWSAWLENSLTGAKLILLAFLGVAMLAWGDGAGGAFSQDIALVPAMTPASWSGFGLALVTVMWSYSGWSSVAAMAGEVKDPGRNLPRALFGGILAVLAIYLLINAAYLYVLPVDAMARSPMVAADAAAVALGGWGGTLISLVVVVATFGAVQAAMMFNPRIFFAMAQDGLLFAPIGGIHSRFLTPHMATLFTAFLGVVFVLSPSFEQLAQAFILGVWPFHILMVWAVFKFRKTRPDAERPYRTWGYPVVPALFLVASAAMILNALFQETGLTLFGFGLILSGVPVYWLVGKRSAVRS
ncbi:MAG: amino acid permease [Gemmatimonadota bacterium]